MIRSKTLDGAGSGYIAALGTFDGVHIGHAQVIKAAASHGLPVAVVTSEQNPRNIISGGCGRILSPSLSDEQFERLSVDAVIRLDFNLIRDMSPAEYLDLITEGLGLKGFSFGFNYRFGKNASGNPETVQQYASRHGLFCDHCPKVEADGQPVSSSRIRSALADGDISLANRLLGRPYAIDFEVCHGDERGRTLGFPTINQPYPDRYALPKFGVYASKVTVNGDVFHAVTDIGVRPTFGCDRITAETCICGFEGDLYGKKIKVELLSYLRPEIKFDSVEQLADQIGLDKSKSLNIKL